MALRVCVLWLCVFALASGAGACPDVVHLSATSNWETHTLVDAESGSPVVAMFDVTAIGPETDVEVFDGSEWVAVSAGSSTPGTMVRLTSGGDASVAYRVDGCEDDIIIWPDE